MAKPGKVAGPRAQQYRIQYPLTAVEVEHIDTMFETLFRMFWNNGILINVGQITGVLPVVNGGTGDSAFTPYQIITGGATPTGQLLQISSGTTGQVLTSNGPGVAATFQPGVDVTEITNEINTINTEITNINNEITTINNQITILQEQVGNVAITIPGLQQWPIDTGGPGDVPIVPSSTFDSHIIQPNQVVQIYSLALIAPNPVEVVFKDGPFNYLSGGMTLGSMLLDIRATGTPWYVCSPGNNFVLHFPNGGTGVAGTVWYTLTTPTTPIAVIEENIFEP